MVSPSASAVIRPQPKYFNVLFLSFNFVFFCCCCNIAGKVTDISPKSGSVQGATKLALLGEGKFIDSSSEGIS